jgi:large subunit ribosomal protein L7/L12
MVGLFKLFSGSSGGADSDDISTRLAALERKIDGIMGALGISPESGSAFGSARLSPVVQQYLARGQKIEAIKAYREETGVGLKEAKDAVDGKSGPASNWQAVNRKLDRIAASLGVTPEPEPFPTTTSASPSVVQLIRAGRKIEAIKVYREENGVGLKEAKDAVDALERQI